jgi:hypothetical protein
MRAALKRPVPRRMDQHYSQTLWRDEQNAEPIWGASIFDDELNCR